MKNLPDRVKDILEEEFSGNIKAFSTKAGVKYETVRNWLRRGVMTVSTDDAAAICANLGVSAAWLLLGKGERRGAPEVPEVRVVAPHAGAKASLKGEDYFAMPLIAGGVAAGSPRQLSDAEIEGWVPVLQHPGWTPHPDRTVCVRVAGDSMEPTIPDGGLVAVDLAQTDARLLKRTVVCLRRDDAVTIKRLFQAANGAWIGRPDNLESVEIYSFNDREIADALVGRVVWWWGRG